MTVLVYEADLGVYLNKNAGFKNLKWKAGEEMVAIELDKLSSATGTNAVLVAEVQERAWPVVKKEADPLARKLKDQVDSIEDEKKREAAADKLLQAFRTDVGDELQKVAIDVFQSYVKDKSDYRIHVAKSGVRILIDGAGLALAGFLTATAGWTGIGTVAGGVMMARSLSSIVQQIYNEVAKAEAILERIKENSAKLAKQLAGEDFKVNTLKQAGAAVVNAALAIEVQRFAPTVTGLSKDLELLDVKIKDMHTDAAKLVSGLPELLDSHAKVAPAQEVLADLVKLTGKKTSDYKKLTAELDGIEAKVRKAVEGASELMARVRELKLWVEVKSAEVETLKKAYDEGAVKKVDLLTRFVVLAGAFCAGNWSSPDSLLADLKGSKEMVASLALANDGLGTVKELGDQIYDAFKKNKA